MISIQQDDFNLNTEIQAMTNGSTNVGAVVSFIGLVRDLASSGDVTAIELEHYPAMTEKSLADIIAQAQQRWPLLAVRVIHRIGYLKAGEQIVLVAVASQHRQAAFDAAAYMMDFLKTKAPFWKKEYINGVGQWVEAKTSDNEALQRWS
jgi:molybdopterin synthase catalytic subunit